MLALDPNPLIAPAVLPVIGGGGGSTNCSRKEPALSTATLARPPDPAKVNQVLKWILAGATEQDIREAVAHHFPGDDAGELLGSVMIGLVQTANFTPDVVIGWCFEACRDLYRRMVEAADYAGALRAVKMMADIARDHVPSPQPEQNAEAAAAG